MAAAARTALLGSVATKMKMTGVTAAPRHPLSVLLGGRRSAPTRSRRPFSSSSRPSAVDNNDASQNKNVPGQLHSAKYEPMSTETKVLFLAVVGASALLHFGVTPRAEALRDEVVALRRERSILIKAVEECQRTHIEAQDDSMDP